MADSFDEISREKVFNRVHLWMSYYGGKRAEDLQEFDRLTSYPSDEELLGNLYDEALNYLKVRYSKRADMIFASDNGDGSERPGDVESSAVDWLCSRIAAEWLFLIGEKDSADHLMQNAAIKEQLIDSILPHLPIAMQTDNGLTAAHPRRLPPF